MNFSSKRIFWQASPIALVSALIFIALFIADKKDISLILATVSGVLGGGIFSALYAKYYDKKLGPEFYPRIAGGRTDYDRQVYSPVVTYDDTGGHTACWLRGSIRHQGAYFAQGCEVLLAGVQYLGSLDSTSDNFRDFHYYDNLPLKWAARLDQTSIDLLPGIDYCFDLICIRRKNNSAQVELRTPKVPSRYEHIFSSPGRYLVSFVVGAKNAQPARFSCRFEWKQDTDDFGKITDDLYWVENSLDRE